MKHSQSASAPGASADSLRDGLPLGFWFSLCTSVLLIVVIGVVGWLSWQNGQRAAVDLARQLQARAGELIEKHLYNYIDAPHIAVELLVGELESNTISVDEPESVYRMLLRLARLYPDISYLNIGVDDGRFFGLGRADNVSRDLVVEETRLPDLDVLYQYRLDAQGRRAATPQELPFGDFRQQVWYSAPMAAGAATWTRIYNWVDNADIVVVGMGKPVQLGAATRAVVGIDLFLSNISDYLGALRVSPGARVFILESGGRLVASSHGAALATTEVAGARTPDHSDPLIDRSVRYLEQQGHGVLSAGTHYAEFLKDGERYFLRVSRWRDRPGLDWLIAVVVPEKDFTARIDANLRLTLAYGAGLLVLSLLVALMMARYMTGPVRAIEAAANAVAAGDFDTRLPRSPYREFNRLAHAFGAMRQRLQGAFAEVETAQHELEAKVEQRTEELRHANAELERLTRQDSLTGLANRRSFDPWLREKWARACRSGEALTLVMCDIDFFKAYNDRYGHGPGDEALRRVASALQSAARRPGDLAARYGGEEYALILPGTSAADAAGMLQHIRDELHALDLVHEASPLGRITMSYGVACHHGACQFASMEELLKMADQALYRAKASGRDRVVVHGCETDGAVLAQELQLPKNNHQS